MWKRSADLRMLQILITRNRHFDGKGHFSMAILIDTSASISFISSLDVAEKRRKQR